MLGKIFKFKQNDGLFDPFFFIMVFLMLYFSFGTLIATILLKNPLIRVRDETVKLQEEQENKDTNDE